MGFYSTWTDERIGELEVLWNRGLTAAQIAIEMGGLTRNAVLGKVNRLRLGSDNRIACQSKCPRRGPSEQALHNKRERDRLKKERKRIRIRAENLENLTFTKSSPSYRRQLPRVAEMTKREMRDVIASAMRNTAAMAVA